MAYISRSCDLFNDRIAKNGNIDELDRQPIRDGITIKGNID